jgi:hypothetical protein
LPDVQLLTPGVSLSNVYSVMPFGPTKNPAGARETLNPSVGATDGLGDAVATGVGAVVGAGVAALPLHAATTATSRTEAGIKDRNMNGFPFSRLVDEPQSSKTNEFAQ